MKKQIIFLPLILVATSAGADTPYYRCTDERGQAVFSGKSCGVDSQPGIIESGNTISPSSSPKAAAWVTISASNALREAERKIDRHQERISSLKRSRDARLAALRGQRNHVNNNLAGAQLVTGLATEMQAVTSQYQNRLDRVYQDIERLENRTARVRQALAETAGPEPGKH
jgi:hypothetical protein